MKLSDIITYKKPLNRNGMFSTWTAQIGDITSVQATKEQAEEEVVKATIAAVTGYYEPVLLFKNDFYALCWRDCNNWCYCIRKVGTPVSKGGVTMGFASRDECVAYAAKHLEDYE